MPALQQLENALDDLFVKKAPKLPESGKKFLVQYLPWINLILGVFTLWAAWVLWQWAHTANALINYANSLSLAVGGTTVATNRMSFGIWLGVFVLAVEGVLYVAAFPGTRDRKKSGWNLLYYALLINVVYGVIIVFTSYGGFGNLISYVVGSVIGLYFLFQIKSSYQGKSATSSVSTPSTPKNV